jgi:tRNA A37 threonylcarbamoyladenosine dehydratase
MGKFGGSFRRNRMNDRFKRVVDFYGENGFQKIRNSRILVAGLGGVGSHCASALARSGVGSLVLIDFDAVTESSLNRNSLVGIERVGCLKTEALARALSAQCPDTEYIPVEMFISADALESSGFPMSSHVVVDAIDSLNPKTQLLEFCVGHGQAVFSSMGAAGRRDPSKIKTGDIGETTGCPLAGMVRKYLKRRGITSGVSCVWSTEAAVKPLPPDENEPRLDRRGRIRNTLPSLITMPGIFGYTLAQMVLDHIAYSQGD